MVAGDAESMKRIFQTKQRLYDKDLAWAYFHFLDILGTGLVTANGALWQKQRLLIGPALRTEMLDDVAVMGRTAVDRLTAKLQAVKGSGRPVNMDDQFRLLTLQVIGEAVLSLPPEECDKVRRERGCVCARVCVLWVSAPSATGRGGTLSRHRLGRGPAASVFGLGDGVVCAWEGG